VPNLSNLPPCALFTRLAQLAALDLPYGHGSGHGSGYGSGHGSGHAPGQRQVHRLASVSHALSLCVASLALAPLVGRHEDLNA